MQTSSEIEREITDEERLGAFLSTLADRSAKEAQELDAEIEELPDPLKRRVQSFDKRLQKLTALEPQEREALKGEYERAVKGAYLESMTNLSNRRFVHEHLVSLVKGIVRTARSGKLDSALAMAHARAFISFDLDGLKVVNDVASSKSGDEYIKLFAEVLRGVQVELKSEYAGASVEIARDGGDEFSLVIDWPEHVVDLKMRDAIVRRVQEKFAACDVRGIINLSATATADELKKRGLNNEQGFDFRPSVSGGGTSFYDALRARVGSEKLESGYDAALASIAGLTRDLGNIYAKKVKARMRREMHASKDPNEQFMAKLFDQFRPVEDEEKARIEALERQIRERDEIIQRLESIITTLESKYEEAEAHISQLQDAVAAGKEMIADKNRELAELRLLLESQQYEQKKRAG